MQVIDPPPSADLLVLIEEVMKMDETMKRYFTEEQLATLTQRYEQAGDAAASEMAEWPQLIAQVQTELDAGTDPASPRVQALARRWMELLESFHGGDPGLRDSLYRMQAENSETLQRDFGGPTEEQLDYIRRANAVAP
ncbi:MAG: TipAS antibiotic-recognition domain-containing protein [Pseudonocardiaceae bacterium]